jgi:hypothetical protein|tara:strand:- start:584 stop:1003 length:420 start_codon:yes stop_codon:yes gene_type:complete
MSFSLKAMFSAVQEAIVESAQAVEANTFAAAKDRYFTENKDGSFDPKTVRLNLPHNGEVASVDVPLFTLAKHTSLVLDEASVSFEIDLDNLGDGELTGKLPKGFLGRRAAAKIELKFKGAEAAEGVMLINDKIQHTIPR